jgi:hypothetical protein
VSAVPPRFVGTVTRHALAEMLAHTHAAQQNIDPNAAYLELETALADVRLIGGIQLAMYQAMLAARPKLDANALVELVGKKTDKRRSFRALKVARADQSALAALSIAIGSKSGTISGEAWDLLETAEGQKLLDRGLRVAGEGLALAILK